MVKRISDLFVVRIFVAIITDICGTQLAQTRVRSLWLQSFISATKWVLPTL